MKLLCLLVLLSVLVIGCKPERMSAKELNEYLLDPGNGLRIMREANGVDLEMIYRPSELVAGQQLEGMTDPGNRNAILKQFTSRSYFVMKLSRNGQEIENAYAYDNSTFSRVVDYLSFSVANRVSLIIGSDTLPALDAAYSRTFGSATATSLMIVFEGDIRKKVGPVSVVFDDTELGLGFNQFEFDTWDMKKVPTLKIKMK